MTQPAITRIVVGLDAVSDSRAAIETATALAQRWHAKLHGVFVEDEALLHVAALPFTRQVSPRGAHALEADAIEDEFRTLARHARALIAEAARTGRLDWSFETVRAGPSLTIGEAGDFIVLQADARPFAEHIRLPSRRRPAPVDIRQPTLMLRRHGRRRRAVVAIVAGVPTADAIRALAVAAEFAAIEGGTLTILADGDPLPLDALGILAEQLAPHRLRIESAARASASLSARMARLDCGVLAFAPGVTPDAALTDPDGEYDLLFLP
ncbi:MAG TPA: hypothetical protein VMB81_20550 [Candidatus Sulfotelmatobacter sp.]|nr:hypothetical protein [Candidatus Sulfotelmatobacter sp.]